jgi:hypothetical protein
VRLVITETEATVSGDAGGGVHSDDSGSKGGGSVNVGRSAVAGSTSAFVLMLPAICFLL